MKRVEAFIDQIEADVALLLVDGKPMKLSAALLPEGAREGQWIAITLALMKRSESDGDRVRDKLSSDDDGGDLKL